MARIVVYTYNGSVESVDVESVDELCTTPPIVIVVDKAFREVRHNAATSYIQSTDEIDETVAELVNWHNYTEVEEVRGEE